MSELKKFQVQTARPLPGDVGGFGFFATLEGPKHAVKKNKKDGDGVEAIFEGVGVACTSNKQAELAE
ncbi:hypothetical protein Q667_19450 [Marinobacter sp. C1S70]|uniref:hypothetical protein n=1 Tax=Marinobacter sp. C1S70 TaxID=1396859 RepID=UPI0003B8AFC7|nr:hypothetical protein [Marinobacter sp. C1S70]ERS81709.1 hypothetical protein Q667_19450 [Marinobacter sp. C1S70]